MLKYHSAYYPIEDGWFMARVLDFPGVISQGRSLDQARKMIRDALCLMAEHKLEKGETLPRPNPRSRDKKAVLLEAIHLKVHARTAAP